MKWVRSVLQTKPDHAEPVEESEKDRERRLVEESGKRRLESQNKDETIESDVLDCMFWSK